MKVVIYIVSQKNCTELASCNFNLYQPILTIFTRRHYASTVYGVIMCLYVCLSICHKSVFKGTQKCRTIAQGY